MDKKDLIKVYHALFWKEVEHVIEEEKEIFRDAEANTCAEKIDISKEFIKYCGVSRQTWANWIKQYSKAERSNAYAWKDAVILSAVCAKDADKFLLMMALSGNSFENMSIKKMQVILDYVDAYDAALIDALPIDRVEYIKALMKKYGIQELTQEQCSGGLFKANRLT